MKIFPHSNAPASAGKTRTYWLVRMNRRNRGIFYLLLFIAVGSHFLATGASAAAWGLLALQFLLYPQLAYFWALHARDQREAEHRNQVLDALWAGCWIAGLGFPLWIAFTMFAGACLHMVVFYGPRGLPLVMAAMGLSAGLVWACGLGRAPHFDTDLRTTALSMVSLTIFFVTYALDGYRRAMDQHRSEMKLRTQFEEIKALQARLYQQTICDPLTGLLNRRHLGKALPAAVDAARAGAGDGELALLLLDIDHFKGVNDRHGHEVGDEVLTALARLMQADLQPGELAYRHGGEEFLLLLPGCSRAAAFDRAERLRQAFAGRAIGQHGEPIRCTLSCGLAHYPEDGASARELLRAADHALYRAKDNGRNRSEACAPDLV